MLQLILLCCKVVWCRVLHSLVLVLLDVWVWCIYYVTIIIIIIIIISIGIITVVLHLWSRLVLHWVCRCLLWVLNMMLYLWNLLWYTGWVSPVSSSLLVSILMLVGLLVSCTRPLLSSRMLWRHPRGWGALTIFWACAKKTM
jgi:hypothetical protein